MNLLSRIRQLLGFSVTGTRPMHVRAKLLDHPLLGQLTPDQVSVDCLVGRVLLNDESIEIRISPDDKAINEALLLMVDAIASLAILDQKCRRLIAKDGLEGYNTEWRFGRRPLPDGSFEAFEKPQLSQDEFCKNLQLQSLVATGNSLLTFWYGDNDMFWGHSFSVDSFAGVIFEDTNVSMIG